jgi:5-methyltetrahydropteroyltriglutamate--homocysteine methyltransferase
VKRSTNRILTTHAGSLPRPDRLVELNAPRFGGQPVNDAELSACLAQSVRDVVRRQREASIDVVGDGEFGKATRQTIDYGAWMSYAYQRLAGFEPVDNAGVATGAGVADVTLTTVFGRRDRKRFPEFYQELPSGTFSSSSMRPMCTGHISYRGHDAIAADVANLKAALQHSDAEEGFMTAIAPGSFARGQNLYYDTEEAFLFAIGEAMREEYQTITGAGFLLQIDDPWLAELYNDDPVTRPLSPETHVEVINHALRGIPQEQIRFHTCYGINEGPRIHDAALRDYVHLMLRINAGAYSFEGANPRHQHEWHVWEDVKLPEGKIVIPGMVSHASNIVEHPELIADLLVSYAKLVGRENVIAGSDCGFSSQATFTPEVHPTVVWAKFQAMAEGARLATERLWS